MSDSVDRVFVHALATVRRLPRTGSSRPPPSARLRLYGLYKQSMEGDVSSILPRPSLPVSSPNPGDPSSTAVQRYGSRDLRTRETQAEIEKWDAWHACEGMTRTEAKRRYISILIDTMKEYASGTSESRELVSELEFVWNQIKSQSGSDESEEGESPTRKLMRAGLGRTDTTSSNHIDPPGPGRGGPAELDGGGRGGRGGGGGETGENAAAGSSLFGFTRIQTTRNDSQSNSRSSLDRSASNKDRRQQQKTSKRPQIASTSSGLRILSPLSQHSSDGIVENEELPQIEPEAEPDSASSSAAPGERMSGEDDDDENEPTAPADEVVSTNNNNHHHQKDPWRTQIESHLQRLTLELTALREQLSSHSLLSRSSFSHPNLSIDTSLLPFRKRLFYSASGWIRWAMQIIVRQLVVQLGLLTVLMMYGRWKGDRRVENWVRRKLKEVKIWISEGGLWNLGWRRWMGMFHRITI